LEETDKARIATTLFWEITAKGVFMEAWTPDAAREKEIEINLQIEEPTVVWAFWEHFDDLWKSINPVSKDIRRVIVWLEDQIASFPK
jgi:hypothetical protein